MEGFMTGTYPPRVWRDLGVGPRGNVRRALPPRAPSNQQSPSGVTQWGWGFHILQSSIDPGDLRFFLWVVRVVEICMYGFVIRGWELILPGCGGTLALARRATFAARCLHEPHPISNHPVGLPSGADVSTPCGAVSTREMCICPRLVVFAEIWKDL